MKNILNIHYAYILKQFCGINNDKYTNNALKPNKIIMDKYDKIKYKSTKIFNLLYFCVFFILLNPSLSNLKINILINENSIFEPIIYTKYITVPFDIKINGNAPNNNIDNQNDYLKLLCQSNQCNVEISLNSSLGESKSQMLNGEKMFEDCRSITSISFSSPNKIYFFFNEFYVS